MKRIIVGMLFGILAGAAFATNYDRVCHACDPGDFLDQQVESILQDYSGFPNGTTVTIQDDRLENGRYYYYVKWEKKDNTFNQKEQGDRQIAENGGGGTNPTPGGNIPPGTGGNYGGGCIGNCGAVYPHVVVGPVSQP